MMRLCREGSQRELSTTLGLALENGIQSSSSSPEGVIRSRLPDMCEIVGKRSHGAGAIQRKHGRCGQQWFSVRHSGPKVHCDNPPATGSLKHHVGRFDIAMTEIVVGECLYCLCRDHFDRSPQSRESWMELWAVEIFDQQSKNAHLAPREGIASCS